MTPAERFHNDIGLALSARPYVTTSGVVVVDTVDVFMGSRHGSHSVPPAWLYKHNKGHLEMVFQFYRNFSDYDLICKVTTPGNYPTSGEGASVQLNSNHCITASFAHAELSHHGRVTVKTAISRDDLVNTMSTICPRPMQILGISWGRNTWPLILGNTGNIPGLLDRLFLYAYCIEQVKHSIRGEQPLPLV